MLDRLSRFFLQRKNGCSKKQHGLSDSWEWMFGPPIEHSEALNQKERPDTLLRTLQAMPFHIMLPAHQLSLPTLVACFQNMFFFAPILFGNVAFHHLILGDEISFFVG